MGESPSASARPSLGAWQPLTLHGVAAFASASWTRVACVLFLVAGLATGLSMRFISQGWLPALDGAVARLPSRGAIHDGHLEWPNNSPTTLADSSFLALVVNPSGRNSPGQSADIQVEFGSAGVDFSTLLGYTWLPYPPRLDLPLNQPEMGPRFGAWRPAIQGLTVATLFLALLITWGLIALVATIPLRLYALILSREVSLGGCARLALASLMTGALVMTAAIYLYSQRQLSLLEFLLVIAIHLVVDLLYLVLAPLRLPKRGARAA